MSIITATAAKSKLLALIDETTATHQPIVIIGARNNAVLIAEEDWTAINETLYLLTIPGMRQSIKDGLATDLSDCREDMAW